MCANSSVREVKRVVMAVTLTPKKNKLKTLFVGALGGSAGWRFRPNSNSKFDLYEAA